MSSPKFAETHNVVAFLEKHAKSNGFVEIIDFLKASSVSYVLTVNPIIYTSYIQQFWATAQVKMVNEVRQLQALIDKKKVIITEASIRNDLHLNDAKGTDCLPNTTIFEELAKIGYEKPSQKLTSYKSFFSPQWKFMIHTITESLSAKTTAWNEFSSTMASLIICLATNRKFNLSKYIFDAMVKHLDGGVKFLLRKQRTEAEVANDETEQEENITTPSNDLLPSGEDSMQLNDLMAIEIASLNKRVDKLEKRRQLRTIGLKRFKKLSTTRRVRSSNAGLGTQEDASKQGMSIKDINADAEVTLVNETQEQQNEDPMFDTRVLDDDEVFVDVTSSENDKQSTKLDDSTAGEAVTIASVKDSVAPIVQVSTAGIGGVTAAKIDELTLAQTLIEIKAAKPKVVTTAATTTTTIRPKAKGVLVQEPSEFRVPQEAQPSISKDKGKAMIEADRLLAERLQSREIEELTDEEKGKLFIELIENRRKHFAALRAQEKRNRPPTKAQKRTQMSTYLKHESKEKKVEGSEETAKGSRKKMLGRKRVGKEQQQESSKKQRMEEDKESDEVEEVKEDDADF
ncbi:hypothetical protein Tco_1399375 [Tanacetum coccineum]